jgi:hypothetical protein
MQQKESWSPQGIKNRWVTEENNTKKTKIGNDNREIKNSKKTKTRWMRKPPFDIVADPNICPGGDLDLFILVA